MIPRNNLNTNYNYHFLNTSILHVWDIIILQSVHLVYQAEIPIILVIALIQSKSRAYFEHWITLVPCGPIALTRKMKQTHAI